MSEAPAAHRQFVFPGLPSRVVFGAGSLAGLADEVAAVGWSRVLLIASQRVAGSAQALLGERCVAVVTDATMHVPSEQVDAVRTLVTRHRVDGCVIVGGGSAIGLGKAIALADGPGLLAVPTTFSGSEMTSVWGMTEQRMKRTGRDPRVQPRTVVYDPMLLADLPFTTAAASGLNSIAHAVESLYAADVSPLVRLMAHEGVRSMGRGLRAWTDAETGDMGRADCLYGASLNGSCLAAASMGLHHKLCHVLGGSFGLPHAETHAVLLPHVVAFNAPNAPDAIAVVADALGVEDPAAELQRIGRSFGLPSSLGELGFTQKDVAQAAAIATSQSYPNPRPITEVAVARLLASATTGEEAS